MTRYKNLHLRRSRRTFWDLFLWKIGHYDDPKFWGLPPEGFCYPAAPPPFSRGSPSVLWIGHCTFLIELPGLTILTDPIWGKYCSPVSISILRRQTEPPFSLADLPPIDLVLLSHNHYDHLDAKTALQLRALHPRAEWVVPKGLRGWFFKRGFPTVHELGWWQTHQNSLCSITAVPAQHFSGRSLWDKNRTHWNGYVLEAANKRLYFAGDTGYNPIDFKAIGDHWPAMDLSLLPIGTYSPREFMEPVHVSPYEAVKIHRDVRSLFSIGMHWGTFHLSDEPPNRPPYDLYLAMQQQNLPFERFLPVPVGLYVNF